MSQKESLSQYSCYNYTFPSQSRNGANSLNPNTFSENTLTSRKAIDSSDCLSLSTSHYVRMLKQKYQRNGRENRHKNKVFEKCSAYHQSLPTTTSIGNHSSFEDENARKQSHETENEVVLQSPIRKTRIVSGNDDEFATYREALVKQATIENETLSSIEIQQLFQQQLVFQEELRTIQNNLQNLEEILKEAQYDRTQQDKNLQNFMQKFEEKVRYFGFSRHSPVLLIY
ncbi:hypothetical protein Gasu2_64050 [Galdieria sulphuraria]|nr:hypothetical protein Gasu2_64050 [Galdieria sulphuraria]